MSDGFNLGPIRIYWYSLVLLVAVWVSYALLLGLAKKKRLSVNLITDATLLALVASVIGARLGFMLQNWSFFTSQPAEIFRLTSGGLSIHGALLAGGLALYVFAKRRGMSFLQLTDIFALPLLAGQVVGRLGNYFNQELYGYPTGAPWAITIDPAHRLPGYFEVARYHPAFLYEMFLYAIGWLILWRWPWKHTGQLTGGYLIVLGVGRFLTEVFRISDRLFWRLSLAQIVSVMVAGLGVWAIWRAARSARR